MAISVAKGHTLALDSKRQPVGTQNATRAALGVRVQKLHALLARGAGYSPAAVLGEHPSLSESGLPKATAGKVRCSRLGRHSLEGMGATNRKRWWKTAREVSLGCQGALAGPPTQAGSLVSHRSHTTLSFSWL